MKSKPPGSSVPTGVTELEVYDGFVVWNLDWCQAFPDAHPEVTDHVVRLRRLPISGIALDLSGASPTEDVTAAVLHLVDAVQSRGLSVVAHGAAGDFLTGITLDGAASRLATKPDLSSAIATLREYEEMRLRCTSDRGQRFNQLRMPARALSLAPLCAYARRRLEQARVPEAMLADLLDECYATLCETLAQGFEPGRGDLSLSVTVHDGRATLTLLDAGPSRGTGVVHPQAPARVDRIHRFRILDRHNAIVLERDLGEVAAS